MRPAVAAPEGGGAPGGGGVARGVGTKLMSHPSPKAYFLTNK